MRSRYYSAIAWTVNIPAVVIQSGCLASRAILSLGMIMPEMESKEAHSPQTAGSPLFRALAWIGLDLGGPERASTFLVIIYALLIFVPVALLVKPLGLGDLWLFVTAAAAIIPLAKILGTATEELALRVGSGIGGLLNATFGNATELIIAFFALQQGLYEVVKASITGSIIGNVLFVLGLSIFLGGLGREKQVFNRTAASVVASQLTLATGALIIPAAFAITSPQGSI